MKSGFILFFVITSISWANASFLAEYRRTGVIAILQYDQTEQNLRLIGFQPGFSKKVNLDIPDWVLYRTRSKGKYFLPLQKTGSNFTSTGKNYDLPLIQGNLIPYQNFLIRYQTVNSLQQVQSFLLKELSNNTIPGMRKPILQRLVELGEFSKPFSQSQIIYWRNLYFSGILDIPERRLVLQELSRCNLLGTEMIFERALQDIRLCSLAGRLFFEKDKIGFETLMLKYLSNNLQWKTALRQSELLYHNRDCMSQLYGRFDKKNPFNEDLKYFIPVLCIEDFQEGSPVIRQILETDKDPTHFELFHRVAFWVNKTNPLPYAKSIHIFLQNHARTEYLKQSMIYPTLLCALCRAKDHSGYILAIDYLSSLRKKSNPPQLNVALELFRAENPSCFSLEELIADLKQRISQPQKKR